MKYVDMENLLGVINIMKVNGKIKEWMEMVKQYGMMVDIMKESKIFISNRYLNDKKHGFGIFVWVDGRKYEGNWENGKRHGLGKFTNS